MPQNRSSWTPLVVASAMTATLFLMACLAIIEAPLEITMGFVQKIFYFHVPCAWLLMLSTLVCAGRRERTGSCHDF